MGESRQPGPACLACGASLIRRARRYCSNACQQTHAYRAYVERWLAGHVSGADAWGNLSDHVRRYLFETQRQCVLCGWAQPHPVTGRAPLHVDHADGDWQNNRPANLRLLCPNCHALTPSYGALNRGRGRPYHMVKRATTTTMGDNNRWTFGGFSRS